METVIVQLENEKNRLLYIRNIIMNANLANWELKEYKSIEADCLEEIARLEIGVVEYLEMTK